MGLDVCSEMNMDFDRSAPQAYTDTYTHPPSKAMFEVKAASITEGAKALDQSTRG
jgi:hypothetical protein